MSFPAKGVAIRLQSAAPGALNCRSIDLTTRTVHMAADPLRVGLIGAGGRWGPWAHVPALRGLPETQLYAVCTAHADTAQAAADKYGVKHAYSDVKALGK